MVRKLKLQTPFMAGDRLRLKFHKPRYGTRVCVSFVDDLAGSFTDDITAVSCFLPLEQEDDLERACAAFNKEMDEGEARRAAQKSEAA